VGRHRLAAAVLGFSTLASWLIIRLICLDLSGIFKPRLLDRAMSPTTASMPDDPVALKALVAELQAQNTALVATVRVFESHVQALQLRIAKLKRQAFGKTSEKVAREIEQLELALEDLLIAKAEANPAPPEEESEAADPGDAQRKPRRRPRVSADTPRERRVLDPGSACPDCGGDLRHVGEDVSEMLDMIVATLKVIEIARVKKSCRACEKMVQPPAPTRPIRGSMATASLLAYILVSKFDDHLPLYRLNEIFARMGADIPDTTLVDWCGRAMQLLKPIVERIEDHVLSSDVLHADDTPVKVLDRSLSARSSGELGKGVRKGRIWAYVRDQRPWAGPAPPGAVYKFAADWKQEHVHEHLRQATGILQADAYKGYAKLYEPQADCTVRLREAACWAHLRRDFHDLWTSTKSSIAREALDRIGALYDIEAQITGKTAGERLTIRQANSKPKVEAFRTWAEAQLTRLPTKGDLPNAFRYALARWPAFCLFLEDGRVAIDNNPAERALRPIGIGRKNWLFAGADTGAETLARAMTLIETAKMNGHNPQVYLADVLARINDHKINRLDELLPWNWKPAPQVAAAA
jgi:transposase